MAHSEDSINDHEVYMLHPLHYTTLTMTSQTLPDHAPIQDGEPSVSV